MICPPGKISEGAHVEDNFLSAVCTESEVKGTNVKDLFSSVNIFLLSHNDTDCCLMTGLQGTSLTVNVASLYLSHMNVLPLFFSQRSHRLCCAATSPQTISTLSQGPETRRQRSTK